jgi:hypothetical protein
MSEPKALKTVQYVTDSEGRRTGVLLDIRVWESLVEWIEDATDTRVAVKALTDLAAAGGAREAGWVPWKDAREEWGAEEDPG